MVAQFWVPSLKSSLCATISGVVGPRRDKRRAREKLAAFSPGRKRKAKSEELVKTSCEIGQCV